MLQKKTNWLTNSNAKSHTGWQEKHSIHCSNSALGHFVKRGMGEDSIKYSWETNFLNEAQDCCSFQLASYKYCLEDFVGKYCCWYLYFQYSKMFFDWLKQINCYLSEEWTKDCATLFKSGTQISGKESKWNLCLKSNPLHPPSHQGHISFSFKLHWKWKEWDSTQPAIAAIPVTFGIYWNTFEMQLENIWNWRSMLEERSMPSDLAATPAASFSENTFWFFKSSCWIHTTQEDNDDVLQRI